MMQMLSRSIVSLLTSLSSLDMIWIENQSLHALQKMVMIVDLGVLRHLNTLWMTFDALEPFPF